MDRAEDLTWKWIDGIISQSEADELNDLLASDSTARRTHVECCELESALRSRIEDFDVSQSTLTRIHAAPNNDDSIANDAVFEIPPEWVSLNNLSARLRARRRVRQLALALTVLLAAGIGGFAFLTQPLPMVDARIGHADEKVTVTRNDQQLEVASGFELQAGDVVEIPKAAVASINYDDGTRVVLSPDSQVTLEELTRWNTASKHLSLGSGSLTAHVAKQLAGKSMLIATSNARFRVLGTRFTLEAGVSSSRLDVIEGRVQVRPRDDSAAIDVTQGQFAVADTGSAVNAQASEPRADRGLLALYCFEEGEGTTVHDVSGVNSPLDLLIDRPHAAAWLPGGGLGLREAAIVASVEPAKKIIEACRKSNELSVEAWIKPTTASQSGPARLVTLSSDPLHRNFTLGHGGDPDELPGEAHRCYFIGRVRTTKTNKNGIPDLPSRNDSVAVDLAHVVYTRSVDGRHHLYVDGIERASEKRPGDFSTWDKGFRLALGDEFTRDRPWQGEFFLVAIFSQALSRDEVVRNFRAGLNSR